MKLDHDKILETAEQLKKLCLGAITSNWKHGHTSFEIVSLSKSEFKTIYGMAHPNGKIELSSIYVDTDCIESLKLTIAHELAHLIVGLEKGHNRAFKYMLMHLIACCGIDEVKAEEERKALVSIAKAHKPLSLELWAIFEDGSRESVGKYFKRSKKFTEYVQERDRLMLDGKRIARFHYEEIIS